MAAGSGKNILLFFTADWCVPCRIMKRQVFADPAVAAAMNAQVVPVMVYSGAPGADEVFSQYETRGTPVRMFTDSQGKVLDCAVGKIGKAAFLGMLEKLSSVSP
jgi:protein disulfide-isomerase